jgi:hypothetical protein
MTPAPAIALGNLAQDPTLIATGDALTQAIQTAAADIVTAVSAGSSEDVVAAVEAAQSAITAAVASATDEAVAAAVVDAREQIVNIVSTASGQVAIREIAEEIRDRLGSYGVGIPQEGTTNQLLRRIAAAAEAISIDADSLAIDADTINLSTDELESLLTALGGALGTTGDSQDDLTLIGRAKQIVFQLGLLNGQAATEASLDVANGLLTDLRTALGNLTNGQLRARMLDSQGNALTEANRLPVALDLDTPITAQFSSIVSEVNRPDTPLGANGTPEGTFEGEWEDVRDFAAIVGSVVTDQAGSVTAEFTEDTNNATPIYATTPITIPANVTGRFVFFPAARFFRVRFVNLGPAQTSMRAELRYAFNPPAIPQLALGAQTNDGNLAALTQSHLKARHRGEDGSASGAWFPLNTDGFSLFTLDRAVRDRLGATANPVEGSANHRLAQIAAELSTRHPDDPSDSYRALMWEALMFFQEMSTRIGSPDPTHGAVTGILAEVLEGIAERYGGGKLPVTATITDPGPTPIHTPAPGKRIKLYWVTAVNDPDQPSSPLIMIRIGDNEVYRNYAISHWEPLVGEPDDPLIVDLATAGSVAVTAHFKEVD